MTLAPLSARWSASPRRLDILMWPVAGLLGYAAGLCVAGGLHDKKLLVLLLLPLLILVSRVRPERLFVGWLFIAPLVQGAGNGAHSGHNLYRLLFLVPPLILLVRMATGSVAVRGLWAIDALPALYVGYVVASARLFPSQYTSTASSHWTSLYISVGVGVFAYYFAAFGKTSPRFPELVAAALLWGGVVVAVMTIVDGLTGWNVWHQVVAETDLHRAVATFSSPFELGAYLDTCVAFALAILLFHGPRSLRRPATWLLFLSLPAFYFTFTRGPALAIAVVFVVMVLLSNKARWPSVLILGGLALALFMTWGEITSSAIYKDRLGVSTVAPRVVLTNVAIDLFRQRPLLGQGYATFDQVKLTLPVSPEDLETVQTLTSHDTFLTVLAESGILGLALLVLPAIVIGWRGLAAARRGLAEPWIVAGCLGTVVAFAIGAVSYDARFFPLVTGLVWLALGLLRKTLAGSVTASESS